MIGSTTSDFNMRKLLSSHTNVAPVYVQTDNTQGEWTDFGEKRIYFLKTWIGEPIAASKSKKMTCAFAYVIFL